MNREKARQYLVKHGRDYFKRDKSGKGYICPICGSGSGQNGTGITTKDGVHFTCWAGCFTHADLLDIIGLEKGISDYSGKLQVAADAFQIDLDSQTSTPLPEHEPDFTEFFAKAHQAIEQTPYHRGLSRETLDRFRIGYVADWRHPKAPHAPASPRLIIPTSKHSYLARDTRTDLPPQQTRYAKSKVGKVRIFHQHALYEAQKPIFVVEGELDALSILDVGGEAIALGSTSNVKALLSLLERKRPVQPLILSLDNDKTGRQASQSLTRELSGLRIPFYRLDISKPYKDANDAFQADKTAFRASVAQAEQMAIDPLEAEREKLRQEAVASALPDFFHNVTSRKWARCFPTGFSPLDRILDGGLYAGLYIVGAISALGKTTFCLQIADQIAQTGQDVLIFSLEMAQDELIAKSVSRLTFLQDFTRNRSASHAKTTRGILNGMCAAKDPPEEESQLRAALEAYQVYAQNLYIVEGIGDVGVKEIRDRVYRHVRLTGKAPVVVIDYLQILAPANMSSTDKQNTDKAVLELKRLGRDYQIPILGISSFNRDNYHAPVNLASFKESGAIEYSSDVLIGLQYVGMDYQEGESEKAREKRIRALLLQASAAGKSGTPQSIQVKVLKNRNGRKGEVILDFYPMFNYFAVPNMALDEREDPAHDTWKKSPGSYGSRQDAKPKKSKRDFEPEASQP